MQTIKIILGIVCWIFALLFFLCAAAALPNPIAVIFATPPIFFTAAGWLAISRRKKPILGIGKALVVLGTLLAFGFITLIVIPDFIRMGYTSSQNSCVNNLRQLRAAKEEWALENGKTNGTIVTVEDITPYVQLDRNGNVPKCPAGGTYILGRVGEDVRCSTGTSDWPNSHALSDTNDFTWEENFKGAYSILLGLRHVKKPWFSARQIPTRYF